MLLPPNYILQLEHKGPLGGVIGGGGASSMQVEHGRMIKQVLFWIDDNYL